MKRCNACEEKFEDKFSFCPVDGTPLNDLAAALVGHDRRRESVSFAARHEPLVTAKSAPGRHEFNVTIIDGSVLIQRLTTELRFIVHELRRAWPEFKRDPIGLVRREAIESAARLRRFVLAPHALAATMTAIAMVLSAVLTLILWRHTPADPRLADHVGEEPVQVAILNFPAESKPPEGSGVGVGSRGRVGLASGKGEGSEIQPQRSRGGGGGDHNRQPAPQGKVPLPSDIPAPINPPLPKAALPLAGVDLDPALWKNLPFASYGDPRSKATLASKGLGDGGGMGAGNGQGIGDGNGNGFGTGEDGNSGGGHNIRGNGGASGANGNDPRDPRHIFTVKEVAQRARVISKTEPQYTEEARKNQVTGSVILRVVFSRTGEVTDIRAIRLLPCGLTEKAIAAARLIRFIPATSHGQPVSMYMQLEYNFNLY